MYTNYKEREREREREREGERDRERISFFKQHDTCPNHVRKAI